MRIRSIHPRFWDDPKMGRLSRDARLLYIATWNLADDKGILIIEPQYLRCHVFPYDDDVTAVHVERWVAELVDAERILPFKVKDERYGQIAMFTKWQKIDRPSTWTIVPKDAQMSLDGEGSTRARRGLDAGVGDRRHTPPSPPYGGISPPMTTVHSRGCSLPKDWRPSSELLLWAQQHHPLVDAASETDLFVDYWSAASGTNSRKKDWDAAFRVWIAKESKSLSQRRVSNGKPKSANRQNIEAVAREVLGDKRGGTQDRGRALGGLPPGGLV